VLEKTTIFIVNSSDYLPWHPTTDFISSHELLAQDIQTDSMKLLKRIRLETVVTVNHQQLRLWWTLSSSLWPQEAVGEMVNTSYGEGSVTIERISGRRTKRFALLTRSLHSSRQFFPW
jgi:hypothetical protein